jgi:glutamyl/glutaminyl-tRNA synthetase
LDFAKTKRVNDIPTLRHVSRDLQQRAQTLEEALQLYEEEYKGLQNEPSYDNVLLLKGAKTDAETARKHLEFTSSTLGAIPDDAMFDADRIKKEIFDYATEQGRGSVLWPLRVALTGKEKSPDPFTVAGYLGKAQTLQRIKVAIDKLSV